MADDAPTERVIYSAPVPGVVLQPFDGPPQDWLPGHRGVDLAAVMGQPVGAAADGIVAFSGVVAGTPTVSIDHPDGVRTTYQAVTSTLDAGAPVRRGQLIGEIAPSDHCDPVPGCLHWGARISARRYIDPLLLLQPVQIVLLPIEAVPHGAG